MMAPPLFAMLTLLTAIGSLLLFVGMQSWHSRTLRYSSLPMTSKAADLPEERPHTASQFSDCTLDDSANETSDGEPSGSLGSRTRKVGGKLVATELPQSICEPTHRLLAYRWNLELFAYWSTAAYGCVALRVALDSNVTIFSLRSY